jgi:hypothetical protein
MDDATFRRLRAAIEDPDHQHGAAFGILAEISSALTIAESDGDEPGRRRARDLVIRCLERRETLGPSTELLDALVSRCGLYPYLDAEQLGLADLLSYEAHRPLRQPAGRKLVFHAMQAEAYARLMDGENVVLSAPTSFGKSLIIDALLASGRYDNVVVIVPTIALIDEARRRLTSTAADHKVITHPTQPPAARNVWVLTQERALELDPLPRVDLLVVDEFYKLNSDRDPERAELLNQALYRIWKKARQFYLLGPNVGGLVTLPAAFQFRYLPSTDSTVAVDMIAVDTEAGDDAALTRLVREELTGPTLVYCSSPARATVFARVIVEALRQDGPATAGEHDAAVWVAKHYAPDWSLVEALKAGVGIHHGRIPRALAHWMVQAFNADDAKLRFLVCTSTLIEGVNTTAKNVVIVDHKLERKALDLFTFNNIRGRSGRMFKHFTGRVYLFGEEPGGELGLVDIPVLTQPETAPESLLLEVDELDLSSRSKDRLAPFLQQDRLSLDALKANPGVDLQQQLDLAETLGDNPGHWSSVLGWANPLYPEYDQLKAVVELIWDAFPGARKGRRWGAGSASALTHALFNVRPRVGEFDPATLIESQRAFWVGKDDSKTPDDIVLDVLTFLRNGVGFGVPRYLRVVDTIQREVLARARMPSGDLRPFAAALEGLFMPSPLAALDEYGLPPEVAVRLRRHLVPPGEDDSLDAVLARLKGLPRDLLDGFDQRLLDEAQRDL